MGWLEFENLEIATTVWTIRLSLVCLAATLALRLLSPVRDGSSADEAESSESLSAIGARNLWLLGSFFSLLHALAAMGFYHHWSHQDAVEDTARQTQALLGVSVGIGIYFNYAFVLIWLVDAMWWIGRPPSYESRANWINWLVYGFLIFIAINGTMVFESGVVRWIASAVVTFLVLLAYRKLKRKKGS